jgi:hypothetical protein
MNPPLVELHNRSLNLCTSLPFAELFPSFTPDYSDDLLTVSSIPLTQKMSYHFQFRDYRGKFVLANAKQFDIPSRSFISKASQQ